MLNISMKFHENILEGFHVKERTRFVTDSQTDRQTEGRTDRRTHNQGKKICLCPFSEGEEGYKNVYLV